MWNFDPKFCWLNSLNYKKKEKIKSILRKKIENRLKKRLENH